MRSKRQTVIESEPAFMNNRMLLVMTALLIVFMMWSSYSRRQQMQKLEQEKHDQPATVIPGEWVRTRVGFQGRSVDFNGGIVVLETSNGHEMYWECESIAKIGGQSPFADAEQAEAGADEVETVEENVFVLGLDQEDAQSFNVRSTDEQQK